MFDFFSLLILSVTANTPSLMMLVNMQKSKEITDLERNVGAPNTIKYRSYSQGDGHKTSSKLIPQLI